MQTIPLWLGYVDDTFTTVHKDEIENFQNHFNKPNEDIQFIKEIEENGIKNTFSRLLGHSRQKQTTNDNLQKADTYRQITRPVIIQPDLSQGYNYTDL